MHFLTRDARKGLCCRSHVARELSMSFYLAPRAWRSFICHHARVAPPVYNNSSSKTLHLRFLFTRANPHFRGKSISAMMPNRGFSATPLRDACGCAGARSPKHTAYIALGSNLGDRVTMIEQACREMDARGIRVKRTSSLWETEPMYVLDQDRFVNGACEVRCLYRACITKSYSTKVQPLIGGDGP